MSRTPNDEYIYAREEATLPYIPDQYESSSYVPTALDVEEGWGEDTIPPGPGEVRHTDPQTGGQKGIKAERFDLLPWDALEEIARVYGWGAGKYADHNWLRGYKWSWSAGALARHFAKFMLGEDRDPESGCLHLAHAAWHCLTLITFFMRRLGTDDRALHGLDKFAGFGE